MLLRFMKLYMQGTVNGFFDRILHELLKIEDGLVVKPRKSVKSCKDTDGAPLIEVLTKTETITKGKFY